MEELLAKYKALKYSLRLLVLILISLIPGVYLYLDSSGSLEADLELAMTEKETAKQAFDKARSRKANLPKLEEQLAQTESQLLEASKRLPDQFVMDKILQKTAMIAQDVGVQLILFDPQDPIPSNTAFRYAKMPISLQLMGTYAQIATFFDRLVHLKLLIHIKNFQLSLTELEDPNKNFKDPELEKDLIRQQKIKRSRTRVNATADLVVYRTLTAEEQNAIDSTLNKNKKEQENQNERQTSLNRQEINKGIVKAL